MYSARRRSSQPRALLTMLMTVKSVNYFTTATHLLRQKSLQTSVTLTVFSYVLRPEFFNIYTTNCVVIVVRGIACYVKHPKLVWLGAV